MDLSELIAEEEAKRLRNSEPVERWKAIQRMITWADSQATVRRNTPAACLREQNRKLRQLEEVNARADHARGHEKNCAPAGEVRERAS